MKKIIPLLLVGVLIVCTTISASAKVIEKSSPTVKIMNYMGTDPDFPDIK